MKKTFALLLFSAFFFLHFHLSAQSYHPSSVNPEGSLFQHKDLVTLNNEIILADDLNKKTVWYNFWHTSCKPCIVEIPELNSWVKMYKDNPNVEFIAVAMGDSASIRDFLAKTLLILKLYSSHTKNFMSILSLNVSLLIY